jgi:hypothetical protein
MYKRWEKTKRRHGPRQWLKWLRHAKIWQLALLFILFIFISATFLRLNNLGMVSLRDKVESADKSGSSSLLKQHLTDLQHYASTHMNAYPGVIYLQESYNRDYASALAAAANERNPNSNVYQQASITCRDRFQGGTASFRNDYVACVAAAVSNLPSEQQQKAHLPSPELYRYSFSSPLISFDVAGLSVMTTFILGLFILTKLTEAITIKLLLKRRRQAF